MPFSYSQNYSYDMASFFRDIQYNPFNSAKILDFLLFCLWEGNYILSENPSNYKPLIVNLNDLILEYPAYTEYNKEKQYEILGNFVDKIGYTLCLFIEGKRSLPLIYRAKYCELDGFTFGEVDVIFYFFYNISYNFT